MAHAAADPRGEPFRRTSLAWWGESAADPLARIVRRAVVPTVAPPVARHLDAVAPAVRLVTGLALTHRHPGIPLALGPTGPAGRRVHVGDRLPDLALEDRAAPPRLYDLLAAPGHHLLALGDHLAAPAPPALPAGWVREVRLPSAEGGAEVARRLGLPCPAWCLVRPDRHVAAVGGG